MLRYCYCHIVTRSMPLVEFNCEPGTALGLGNYDMNLSTISRLDTGFTGLCVKLTRNLERADWMVARLAKIQNRFLSVVSGYALPT
jgi:hypothetical protein